MADDLHVRLLRHRALPDWKSIAVRRPIRLRLHTYAMETMDDDRHSQSDGIDRAQPS
jgi:hypothetical protein